PFDVIPRVIDARTWRRLEAGLKQRLRALNLFLDDVYGPKLVLKQHAIPPEIVLSSSLYMRQVDGLPVPHDIHCHVAGIDLVRDRKGEFFVLEDNVRTPSGPSYVLANRYVMKRILPDLFAGYPVRPVEGYVHELLRHLRWLAPQGVDDPTVVLLTPGINNSAYYEHLYLAKQMGVELVEGSDLVVDEDQVVKTVDASGGYGMLIGPVSTQEERDEFRRRIEAAPRAFVAQPVVALSVQPIFDGGALRPGHQDLRPFVLTGPDVYVTPGGLTRVALKPGSLVVNSSQGGGSRDTWVMAEDSYEGDAE